MNTTPLAFATLAGVQMTLIAAISLVAVALPAIQAELALSTTALILVTAGYGLTFSGLLVLGGRIGDGIGSRRAFTWGMAIFGLASLMGLWSPGFPALLGARLAQGTGAALVAPAALALAGELFPQPERRARALAAWGGLSATGAVIGMLLSGAVVAAANWRWVFAIPAAVAALALAAAPKLLPAGSRMSPVPLDVPGAALITAGLSALTYGVLGLSGDAAPAAARMWTVFGLVLLEAFVRLEARVPQPLLPLHFFRGYRVLDLLAIALAAAASAATNVFLSLYLQQVQGLSPTQTAAYFLPMLLIAGTGAVAGGWITRWGARRMTAVGLVTTAVALAFLSLWIGRDHAPAAWPGLLLFSIGLGLTLSAATLAALSGVPAGQRGVAGGVVNTGMEVGPTVGLALLVALSRVRSAALMEHGLPWTEATAGGYAFALSGTALAFVLLGGAMLLLLPLQKRRVRRVSAQ